VIERVAIVSISRIARQGLRTVASSWGVRRQRTAPWGVIHGIAAVRHRGGARCPGDHHRSRYRGPPSPSGSLGSPALLALLASVGRPVCRARGRPRASGWLGSTRFHRT